MCNKLFARKNFYRLLQNYYWSACNGHQINCFSLNLKLNERKFPRESLQHFSRRWRMRMQWRSLSRNTCEYSFQKRTTALSIDVSSAMTYNLHFHMVRRGVWRNCAATSSIGEAYSRRCPLISRERGRRWPLNSPSVCLRVRDPANAN